MARTSANPKSAARTGPAPAPATPDPARKLTPGRALSLPFAFTLALAAFGLLPASFANPTLQWSFFGAAAVLLAWNGVLLVNARSAKRTLLLEVVLRQQHYLQACAHFSIYVYWGWYWREVYHSAYLILSQLVFAYAFDMLLVWSRRDRYTLGFGPFPIIFSTNLFLWFKPDWFYLQYLMVATGFLVKELVRWQKDGRSTHVFNPSSFPLSLFSLGLLLTGTTHITWGPEIATTLFYPPHIFLYIFAIGLPGQFLFGVTTMTFSAVVTVYAWSAAYFALTGSYFFFDAYIPIAVFLGMHLLFTDPSTAPRTELGRLMFGVLYGCGVIFLYWFLGLLEVPTFYDKLLPVPVLNLFIQAIDRVAQSPTLKRINPARLGTALAPRRRHLAYMCVWAIAFTGFSLAEGLGDKHPGNMLPFWRKACAEHRRGACRNLATMESRFCYRGIGWACNELGISVIKDKVATEATAAQLFQRACEFGFPTGCANAQRASLPDAARLLQHRGPRAEDYDAMLASKGLARPTNDIGYLEIACNQGWNEACVDLAYAHLKGQSVPRDPARAAREFDKACTDGEPTACSNAGLMYKQGDGVEKDDARALGYLKKACDLGLDDACRWLKQERAPAAGSPH